MLAVFDTNHFRVVAEGGALASRIALRAEKQDVEVLLSIITVQEATGGWLGLINGIKAGRDQVNAYASFQKTINVFQRFGVLPFDEIAAEHFHRLRSEHLRVGSMDLKIAAIRPRRNLVDSQSCGFHGNDGLRVKNWLD